MITHFPSSFSLSRGAVSNTQDNKHKFTSFPNTLMMVEKYMSSPYLYVFLSGRLFVEASIHDEYVHRVVSQAYS